MGSLCGRKTEVCEELRKRKVDVCCIQEVRWKGQGARFVGASGRRYKMWWSGNDAGFGGVGILVKEEISGSIVEVGGGSDRVVVIVLALGGEVMRVVCACGPRGGGPDAERVRFCDEVGSGWDLGSCSEIIVSLGDFDGHVGRCAEGFEGVHGGNGVGRGNAEGGGLLEFCDGGELCVAGTWFRKTDRGKITCGGGGCGTGIDFVLVGERYRKYIRDVGVVPWGLQHGLVVVDLGGKVLKKGVREERIMGGRIWRLSENRAGVRFEGGVEELVNADAPDLWRTFRDGVLGACGEVCGGGKSGGDRGDMWWWSGEVEDAIAGGRAAFEELCGFPSEQSETQYKRIGNQAGKIVAGAVGEEADQELNDLYRNSGGVFCFLGRMRGEGGMWGGVLGRGRRTVGFY